MTYNLKIKRTVGTTDEIIIETTVEKKEDVGIKLKELKELINSSLKELYPAQEKVNPPQPSPIFGKPGVRV